MDDIESIKQKIRKLLALSKSSNENEAETAMRKACELMKQHSLESCDVAELTSRTLKADRRKTNWKAALANAVEHLYATYHVYDQKNGTVTFYGDELDVFMSTEMYGYLMETVRRMAKQNTKGIGNKGYYYSYQLGLAIRLYDRMKELGQQCAWRDPHEFEMKKKEIMETVKTQCSIAPSKKIKKITFYENAWKDGERDAEKINLSRQMNAGTLRIGSAV